MPPAKEVGATRDVPDLETLVDELDETDVYYLAVKNSATAGRG